MNVNSGEPWSDVDVADLIASLDYGDTFAEAASFLCRDEDEVRQKAKGAGTGGAPREARGAARSEEVNAAAA